MNRKYIEFIELHKGVKNSIVISLVDGKTTDTTSFTNFNTNIRLFKRDEIHFNEAGFLSESNSVYTVKELIDMGYLKYSDLSDFLRIQNLFKTVKIGLPISADKIYYNSFQICYHCFNYRNFREDIYNESIWKRSKVILRNNKIFLEFICQHHGMVQKKYKECITSVSRKELN